MLRYIHFRRNVVCIPLATFWVVEHLDVIKHITVRLLAIETGLATNPFPIQQFEEALGNSLVVTVSAPAHAGRQSMGFQEGLPAMTTVPTTLVGINDHRP